MSIGNLKDYGNKGNNFPWQLKVLEGLQKIYNALTGSATGQVRTANILNTSGSGSIPAGAYSFSVANVGAASGTFLGASYNATGTTFLITWVS